MGHQHGRGFIVLGHQYGRRDVYLKSNLYTFSACPGGIQLPCSRRGNCIDGLEGDGSCVCDTGYNGTACESCIENSDSCPGILKKFLLFLSLSNEFDTCKFDPCWLVFVVTIQMNASEQYFPVVLFIKL